MDKSIVMKSKSSNSAITTRSDNHSNKKSRSNAEFQRHAMKKRGVYVEKKATNISIQQGNTDRQTKNKANNHSNKKSRSNAEFQRHAMKKRGVYVEKKATNISFNQGNTGNPQTKSASPSPPPSTAAPKAPPRPKPGQKRFLANVLTILSKSTAATQFPENGANSPKGKTKRKTDARQKKYRSKVLNDEMIKDLDPQKSLVLQYKNVNNSPSTVSVKTRDGNALKGNRSNILKSVSVISSEAKGIVKEVLEGLQGKSKDVRMQTPVTQVEQIDKSKAKGENDEQLYKFFVDLLETTFSVYNVKAEYDAAPNIESGFSSKVAFEIDESVVQKLETRKSIDDDDEHKQPNYYCVKDTNVLEGNNAVPNFHKSREPKELPKQARPKRMKTQSFIYNTKPKCVFDSTFEPLRFQKKTISKRAKKKTLINLFKEQLKVSYSDYEEPQTLYDALRVMAKNKRKNQKAIRFDVPTTKECVFRRPKIISTKKPNKNERTKFDYGYNHIPRENMRPARSYFKPDATYKPVETESYQTLEVYGYDYEVNNGEISQTYNADADTLLQTFPSEDEFNSDNFGQFDNNYMADQMDVLAQGRR